MKRGTKMTIWTDEEKRAVAERFDELIVSPKYKKVHAVNRQSMALRDAIDAVIKPGRRRESAHVTAILETIKEYRAGGKRGATAMQQAAIKATGGKGKPSLAELIAMQHENERKIAEHERSRATALHAAEKALAPEPHTEPLQTHTLEVSIEDAMKGFAEKLASSLGLYVTLSLERLIENMVLPVMQKKMDSIAAHISKQVKELQPITSNELTEALDKALAEQPVAPQQVIVQTTEAVPAEVEGLVLAPRERHPRVAIVGLIRQQMDDVGKEFGDVIDFTFIPTHQSAASDFQQQVARADVIVIMTRFCSHWHDDQAKRSGRPIMRITGSVSMLKAWLQKWFNGEIGLAQRKEDGSD